FVIISMRKALSLFYLCTEIITFPLKGRLSSFIVSGKFPYRVKFYTKLDLTSAASISSRLPPSS
ncbi:hypothetical protein, partial [Dialister succinatiphilus]